MSFRTEPASERYDAVVVGAGIGGLTSAALLARAGKRVLVVERHDRVGGYAHAFRRGPYLFDSAVHMIGGCEASAFEGGGVVNDVISALGLSERCDFVQLDPVYRSVLPGTDLCVPAQLDEFERQLVEAYPRERKGISDFLQACLDIREQTERASELDGPYAIMRAPERFPALLRYRRATLQDVLDDCVKSSQLQALLGTLWPYLGLPPSQVSFLYFATMLMSYVADRAYYCRGTFQRFADALADAVTASGGEVLLRSSVRRIEVEQGRARGIVLENGMRVSAPLVVSNGDARQTVSELVGEPAFPARYLKQLERKTPSISAFVLYLAADAAGLDLEAQGWSHENFFFASDDHDASYRKSLAGRPDWFTLTVPTLCDASLAPEGQHEFVLTTLVPYELGGSWRELKEALAEHMLGLAEERLPGLRDRLRFVEAGTPRTLERYTRNTQGAMYGWELSPKQVGPGRLGPRTPVEGLLLAGHWSQPGGGVYGVVSSGVQTASAALGYKRASQLWRHLGA